jgi:macrolide transport system ATP-binding/permease protein
MRTIRAFLFRLGGLFFQRRRDRELAEEIESNLQFHIEDNLRAGMSPEDARRDAFLKFGGIESAKEAYRERRGLPLLENLVRDIQFALRALLRRPVFAAAAITLLALVIGANTILLSVLDALWLRPLPFRNSERIVAVFERPPQNVQWKKQTVPFRDFLDLQRSSRSFEKLSASTARTYALSVGGGPPQIVLGEAVTANYFDMLGIAPSLGHTFLEGEQNASEVVLSNTLWRSQFHGQSVIGHTITLNSTACTIVGVMPDTFSFPSVGDFGDPEIWTVLAPGDEEFRVTPGRVAVVGVLQESVTTQEAESEVAALLRSSQERLPVAFRPQGMIVRGLQHDRAEFIAPVLTVVSAAVALVFLLACANVAGLLLGRSTERKQEIAVRCSLGATRSRILRQLLTENLLLWFLAGLVGLILATIGLKLLLSLGLLTIHEFPHLNPIQLDWRVAALTTALTFLAGGIFGLLPAITQSSIVDIASVLKEGSRSIASGRRLQYLRRLLVSSELSISATLLLAAGLLLVSLVRLTSQPLGFQPDNLLTFKLLVSKTFKPGFERNDFYARLLEAIRGMPSVASVGTSSSLPLIRGALADIFTIKGQPASPNELRMAIKGAVSPDYFRTLGIPQLAGRSFDERDTETTEPIVIINETFARRFFPNENPIGRLVKNGTENRQSSWMRVVGVVGDIKHANLGWDHLPEMFFPYRQIQPDYGILTGEMFVTVRAPYGAALGRDLRNVVASISKDVPVANMLRMEDVIAESKLLPRLNTFVIGVIGGLAVLLAAAGLYGVLSQFVSQRRHEIGIRMALGATPASILMLVLKEGLTITAIGMVFGLAGGLGLTRVMRGVLWNVSGSDPLVLISIAALMLIVAVAASLLPALRATSLDPVQTLRYE